MFEQKRVSESTHPEFLANAKGAEYSTGNLTIDGSAFSNGDVIPAGTAVHENSEGLYVVAEEPAEGEENVLLKSPMITRSPVKIEDNTKNAHVSAFSKANLIEDLCHNVTDQFKRSSNFFWY